MTGQPNCEQLTALFDCSSCHIAVVDQKHRVVATNAKFDETFGCAANAHCHQLYKHESHACHPCLVDLVFSDGQSHTSKEQGISANDKAIFYEVEALPLFGESGQVEQALLISKDTTRLVELEEGLSQAERLAHVGLTTAGLAHTIKNILAGLEGGTYMVDTGLAKNDSERLESGWKMVKDYITQVEALVQNLLSYARQSDSRMESADLADLVREIVELYAHKATMASVELVADIATTASMVIDRPAMHAALANLVTNAIDACTWDPDLDKEHRIVVSLSPHGSGVRLAVTDNGTGISPKNQQRLLVTTFTTKGIRGTGLGLLLTKKTAMAHGGTLSFESHPGEGTVFRIDLPFSREAES